MRKLSKIACFYYNFDKAFFVITVLLILHKKINVFESSNLTTNLLSLRKC